MHGGFLICQRTETYEPFNSQNTGRCQENLNQILINRNAFIHNNYTNLNTWIHAGLLVFYVLGHTDEPPGLYQALDCIWSGMSLDKKYL